MSGLSWDRMEVIYTVRSGSKVVVVVCSLRARGTEGMGVVARAEAGAAGSTSRTGGKEIGTSGRALLHSREISIAVAVVEAITRTSRANRSAAGRDDDGLVFGPRRATVRMEGVNSTGLSPVRVRPIHRGRASVLVGWHLAYAERDRVSSYTRRGEGCSSNIEKQPGERTSRSIAHVIDAE